MPGTNLTRDEAAKRSSLIQTDSYRIYLDLATGSETTFVSITEIDFTAEAGASTFLDIVAESVNKAVLNGNVLDVDAFADSRLPLEDLAPNNTVRIEATMNYSRTGEGLHRYVDPADGEVYLYSQFEVADARRVFACFEQPDLKAEFTLTIDAPEAWTVLSNSPSPEPVATREGVFTWQFTPTERISTYLVSIIAGPYASAEGDVYRSVDGREIPLGIWARKSLIEYVDADEIYEVTKQGFEFYEANYGFPYPFRKYDQVFCPEYNAGAMEHPGNVTLVESYIFRTKPTGAMVDRRVHGTGRGMVCPVCASHPDSHRRSRSSTWSAGRWMRPGRGLSPPVRTFTDPRAHELISLGRMYRARPPSVASPHLCDHPHLGRVSGCGRTAGGWPAPGLTSCGTGTWWRRRARW